MERAGEIDGSAVARFFVTVKVALEFDIDVARSEDADELIDLDARLIDAAMLKRRCRDSGSRCERRLIAGDGIHHGDTEARWNSIFDC